MIARRRFCFAALPAILLLSLTGCAHRPKMTSEYAAQSRLRSDDDKVQKDSSLSDAEVDWMLSYVGALPKNGVTLQSQGRAVHAAIPLRDAALSQLPQSRLPQIYALAYRMATGVGYPTLPIYTWTGCNLLGTLRNKDALPALKRCLASPDPNIRVRAQRAIDKILERQSIYEQKDTAPRRVARCSEFRLRET